MDIVRNYEKGNPGKVILVESPKHLGYPDCFWDILGRCPKADFYAFSDQDDVWHKDKLAGAVKTLLGSNVSHADRGDYDDSAADGNAKTPCPLLYVHDYDNYDADLELISHHVLGSADILNNYSVLFYTYASGFCMVIDNVMRNLLLSLDLIGKAMYHDELCIWLVHFHGEILYDDSVLTKYRRHESTVTEYGNGVMTLISNWLRREIFGPEFGYKCKRIRTFLKLEKNLMNDDGFGLVGKQGMSKRVMRDWYLLSGGKRNVVGDLKRLFFPRRLRPSVGGEVALRLMFLMNRVSK